ncbi:hypothetical protein ACQP3D_29060, partial [Escherichia coli]
NTLDVFIGSISQVKTVKTDPHPSNSDHKMEESMALYINVTQTLIDSVVPQLSIWVCMSHSGFYRLGC